MSAAKEHVRQIIADNNISSEAGSHGELPASLLSPYVCSWIQIHIFHDFLLQNLNCMLYF